MLAAFAVGIAVGTVCLGGWVWWNRTVPSTVVGHAAPDPLPDTAAGRAYVAPSSAPALPPSPAPVPAKSPLPTTLGNADRTDTNSPISELTAKHLMLPVLGVNRNALVNTYGSERSGERKHEALDIMAARGTHVVAADEGNVVKLFTSKQGGLTVYQFDNSGTWCYYYAHLDRYAIGLKEGTLLRKGETLGYVGSSGNADPAAPHLHFAIFRLGPEKKWWEGTPVDPFPLFRQP
jgi:murein DD-endopeptidase MepM/ murein hydrolase activator NlpD